jgi:glycosyltransferase involved in cell wall biosynthesis
MRKKKVIIVSDFGEMNGGASKVALETVLRFSKNTKLSVTFCAFNIDSEFERRLLISEVEVINFGLKNHKLVNSFIFSIFNYTVFKRLRVYISCQKTPVILHIHTFVNLVSPSVFLLSRMLNVEKVFVTAHDYFLFCPNGSYFNFRTNLCCNIKPLSVSCCLTHCGKRSFLEDLSRRAKGLVQKLVLSLSSVEILPISKISKQILSNHIATGRVICNPIVTMTTQLPIQNIDRSGLVYIGRLEKEKGFQWLCDVCAANSIPLQVVGLGSLYLYKDKFIKYHGWRDTTYIESILDNSVAVVIPSLWKEPFGLVAVEAFQRGVPALSSSNVGALGFMDKKYEYSFEVENIKSFLKVYRTLTLSQTSQVQGVVESYKSVFYKLDENYVSEIMYEYDK